VNGLVFNSQYKTAEVDAFGNIYQLNGTGGGTGPPGIYAAAAYAGGAPLTNLLTVEAPSLSGYYGTTVGNAPNELPLAYGNSYIAIGNPTITSTLPSDFVAVMATQNEDLDIRPSSLLPDNFGTFWYMDNHYPELERIDQYTGLATLFLRNGRATANISPINASPASLQNPYYCVYGSTSSKIAWTQGPISYDPQGDGCPAMVAYFTGGDYQTVSDGLGNIYVGDGIEQIERIMTVGTQFPPTPVNSATPAVQGIQVHFNYTNPPTTGAAIADAGYTGVTTTAFSIAPGIPDFVIDTTDGEFPMGSIFGGGGYAQTTTTANFAMWAGLPTCTQLGLATVIYTTPSVTIGDKDYDCLVYVKFVPTAPGARESELVVTTANGSVYNFGLYGVGTGSQLAIDGGTASPVPATGLGTTAGIAVTSTGIVYIADPTNNRIVSVPAGGGTQSNLTFTGVTPATLSGPMGVAVDASGNVYISDTGNNRVLEVNQATGVATTLGNYVWVSGSPSTAPPQYAFKAPQGIAVDNWNNVYVADTGNAVVVEIPSNIALGGAVPLLAYAGAPKFINPVGVAIDSLGNIYVADTKNATSQIVVLPPGGGDLVTVPGAVFTNLKGSGLKAPGGVAVDAAGNLYVSDVGENAVIEVPAASGPGSTPFALNFGTKLSTPGGIALDSNGNLYVADTGNKQILFDNRQNPMVNFGTVPQDLAAPSGVAGYTGAPPVAAPCPIAGNSTPCTGILTITNIGSQSLTLTSPLTVVSGTGNPAYSLSNSCGTITSNSGILPPGLTCTISPTFAPTSDNGQSETVTVNGGPQSLSLVANGEQPLVNLVLSVAYSAGTTPTAGATATITATATQPHINGNTPTGTVTFSYKILGDGITGTQTVALGAGGTASFALPTLLQGRQYTINAVYNGDSLNSLTNATPLVIYVPGVAVTVTAVPTTFAYGQTPPAITGTVTGITDPAVTYKFTSAAGACTPIGTYPITVVFSGGTYLNYGFPPAVTSTAAPALVTETAAKLTYTIPNFTAQYGALNISYGADAVITGAVCGDGFGASFTPAQSSILNVSGSPYTVVPTVLGADVGDYTVTAPSSTLTITKAPVAIGITAAKTSVLNTAAGVASATYGISVSTTVPSGIGIPSGSVTVTDAFVPITATTPLPATPNFSVSSTNTSLISISDATVGSSIYYTLNGSTPTASSTAYTAPVTVSSTQTLSAIAVFTTGSAIQTSNVSTVTSATLPLTAGSATYTPTSIVNGIHQYSFSYSGDTNFQTATLVPSPTAAACIPSAIASNCLIVDNADFTLTSNTGPVPINPGTVPSGNGLPIAPNQSTAFLQSAVLFVNAVNSFTGSVNLSCTTQNPTYVSCFMTPLSVCFAAASGPACTNTAATAATVVAISTPATLPLGFFNTAQTRMSTTKTVLAFLPFGVLAFCIRRRKRLSKALWMLIAFAAIGAGMSGCGGNQVAFYTPIPTGPQTVTVTASYLGNGSNQPAATRSFLVPIAID